MVDLERLLPQAEGQYFDRKSLWHGPANARRPRDRREVRDQIAEYVAAFANADGGTLVLGVEDDGNSTGHGYPEDAVEQMLKTPLERLVPPQTVGTRVQHAGLELLVYEVAASERAVMVVGNGFPRRVGDEVILESEEAINAIKARGRSESVELDPAAGATLANLDIDLVCRARDAGGLHDSEPSEYLVARRLADYRGDQLVLRRGALLLFARRPTDIDHPNAGVRVFRVAGTERQTGPRGNVQELGRIEGALPDTIEQAYRMISGVIRRSARLHDLFFREMPEYPTFAWQEALVNAVGHRDYRIQGQSVEVWLFDDRMEVVSPGALVAEVQVDALRRRERVHCSRNPRITRVLSELAFMREQGEGIPRIFEEMEESWLRLPELQANPHNFTVVLSNQPILETPDPEWVRRVRSLPIGHRQRRALVAYPIGSFTNADYQRLNEVDRDVAYRELKELTELDLVASEGRGRGARYTVIAAGAGRVRARLTPRQVLALRARERGSIKNADYREVFGTDRSAARRELSALVGTGILELRGARRGAHYVAGPNWDAWIEADQNQG